ncbi:hypothetical protein BJ742DRAFT_744693 [Cladochytrium replicatum]|nr:hypothetical protein BJ742DRAFT_744693 [Cladochytrium replicatum]
MSPHFLAFVACFLAANRAVLAADPAQLQLVNDFRRSNGVGALVEVAALDSCAYAHSVDMSRMGDMTHQGSDGSNSNVRINRCTGATYTGENVGHTGGSLQSVMNAWKNSPPHRANLLNPNYNSVGFGYYNGYWTQNFASLSGVKPPQSPASPPRTSAKPSPSPSPPARTSPAPGAATTTVLVSSPASSAPAPTNDPNVPPASPTGGADDAEVVLLDVDSDSYIIPVVDDKSGRGASKYDDSTEGNAAIYLGDEERLASQSRVLLAKMDASAYHLYLESKNDSTINPFLIISFTESAGAKSAITTMGIQLISSIAVVLAFAFGALLV